MRSRAICPLEFALTRLWEEQADGWLTDTAYEAIGEVDGALATHAEEVVSRISGDAEQVRRVFTQLVRPGEGTTDTRRQATREELGEDGWVLVTQLANEKLVVTDHDERTGHDTVEVAHEALIREWPTLRAGWSRTAIFGTGKSRCEESSTLGRRWAATREHCCGVHRWRWRKTG